MGKYIEKGKRKIEAGEEEAVEVSPSPSPSPLGVRTRAKTKSLALQRLQKANSESKSKSKTAKASPSSSSSARSESCYLQLRSRRLEKSLTTKAPKAASPKASATKEEEENDAGIEVSFGENVLEAEGAGSGCQGCMKLCGQTCPTTIINEPFRKENVVWILHNAVSK